MCTEGVYTIDGLFPCLMPRDWHQVIGSQAPMAPHIQCNRYQCNMPVNVNDVPIVCCLFNEFGAAAGGLFH